MNKFNTLSTYRGLGLHHWDDELPLIQEVLDNTEPVLVIEFGTMWGGFAAFLADAIDSWGGRVLTLDRDRYASIDELVSRWRNIEYRQRDVFDVTTVEELQPLFKKDVCLYCDNGNKMLEITTYAPLLPVGALLGAHDYGTEVLPMLTETYLRDLGYAPYRHGEFAKIVKPYISRFWQRCAS